MPDCTSLLSWMVPLGGQPRKTWQGRGSWTLPTEEASQVGMGQESGQKPVVSSEKAQTWVSLTLRLLVPGPSAP